MLRAQGLRAFVVLVVAAAGLSLACSDGDEETAHRCVYEEQKSQSCGAAPSGAYVEKCVDVEEGSEAYRTECGVYTDDTVCAGGCCKQYRVRNRRFQTGSCAEL